MTFEGAMLSVLIGEASANGIRLANALLLQCILLHLCPASAAGVSNRFVVPVRSSQACWCILNMLLPWFFFDALHSMPNGVSCDTVSRQLISDTNASSACICVSDVVLPNVWKSSLGRECRVRQSILLSDVSICAQHLREDHISCPFAQESQRRRARWS